MRTEVEGLNDRKAVLDILQNVLADGMTVAAACASLGYFEPSKRAWIERMADSVLRHLHRADAVLDVRLSKKPKLRAMNVLRLSVVEMYAESIPAYAAVDQAVRLLKLNSSTRHIASLANAVLRAAAENGKPAWENAGPPRLPHKIGCAIRQEWGQAAVAAIERAHEKIPPLDITPKSPCDAERIAERLGGTILPTGSIRLLRAGRITELPGFAEGEWWVQDVAAKELVVLSDGAPWIRNSCEEAFPGQEATFVLDLFHALHCADAAVKAAEPDTSKQEDWMKTIKGQLNAGRVDDVIADLKPHRRLEAVATCIRYYGTNRDRMLCDLYRKRGLPVGSGVVESACKQIVGSRFKGAGRRWSKIGANAVLAIKCCFRNNRWPDFLDWRDCSAPAA